MKAVKRYLFFLVSSLGLLIIWLLDPGIGAKAVDTVLFSLREMALVIPPIFILLGLLDVWVPREAMVRTMGEDSGVKGVLLSLFLGSAAAGPLYGAFPVAGVFMKKGAGFMNVLLFIGAWSTTKIPMLLFEISALGPRFAFTRLALSLMGIFLIAFLVNRSMKKEDIKGLYEAATLMNE
ncbi:MAG: permease [Clostridia bacterium]